MRGIRNLAVGLAVAGLAGIAPSRGANAQTPPATYTEMDLGTYAITVKLAVKPDRVEDFLRLMKARIQESRTRPEVVDFRVLATNDPLVFVAFESFRSGAAFNAFAATPDSVAFLEKVKGVLARPLEIERLRALP